MVDSTDHVTGKTGLTPTVTISKAGAAFGAPAGAVTEISSGWYKVAGNATDTDTLGQLALHATATGADPTDRDIWQVVSFDSQDAAALGLSRLDAAITTRLAPTVAARTLDVSATGEAGVDWANVGSQATVVGLTGTTVKTATDVETDTQDIQARLPAALVGGRIDANVGAISADTVAADNAEAFFDGTGYAGTNNVIPTVTTVVGLSANAITAAAIATGAIDADALAADAGTELADALLTRDMSAVTGEAARSPLNALRFLRNKWDVAAGTLTVKKEDDATTAWTAAISTDAAAIPVIGSDPA